LNSGSRKKLLSGTLPKDSNGHLVDYGKQNEGSEEGDCPVEINFFFKSQKPLHQSQ
jgi:hypothetical protein